MDVLIGRVLVHRPENSIASQSPVITLERRIVRPSHERTLKHLEPLNKSRTELRKYVSHYLDNSISLAAIISQVTHHHRRTCLCFPCPERKSQRPKHISMMLGAFLYIENRILAAVIFRRILCIWYI